MRSLSESSAQQLRHHQEQLLFQKRIENGIEAADNLLSRNEVLFREIQYNFDAYKRAESNGNNFKSDKESFLQQNEKLFKDANSNLKRITELYKTIL